MLKIVLALAMSAAASGFAPSSAPLPLRLRSHSSLSSGTVMSCAQNSGEAARKEVASEIRFSRKEAVSSIAAAITFGLSQTPAFADDKAACTYANCPPPPADATYELTLFQVVRNYAQSNAQIRGAE